MTDWLWRKIACWENRGASPQRLTYEHVPYLRVRREEGEDIFSSISFELLVKDGREMFLEEGRFFQRNEEMYEKRAFLHDPASRENSSSYRPQRATYNRRQAVRYAERWWDGRNPAYPEFQNDCTNFISQCLRAGGGEMWGSPDRSRGWWLQEGNWSYSWSTAHALRWYLSGARQGLRAKEVETPEQLRPGDVICYDFTGDGRFDHTTIVVRKMNNGMPLVNAHTTNSRHRYWSYEDSAAYTGTIQYKFFQIIDWEM
ncbi:amidase domain-containing protein [Salimicrobium halophilum]|uniref:Putative amidase domain-containing protein n=1 Tax=Salimicrobium halophilum TaxID=86666 RepID=A0A1G8TIH6_9BACI|nr:amidase domain-containing protein [Salimicrobium halophilum]SDJ41338.1 Putative amidase domain-containing protein [Salimicrobium halophilum]